MLSIQAKAFSPEWEAENGLTCACKTEGRLPNRESLQGAPFQRGNIDWKHECKKVVYFEEMIRSKGITLLSS